MPSLATPLYPTFGCLVRAPKDLTGRNLQEGAPALESLDEDEVRSLFLTHGLVLFRGFKTSLDSFTTFSERLCESFLTHRNKTHRISLSDDGTIVTANTGPGHLWLHGEMYYLPIGQRPDVLWLYCSTPPEKDCGGETTVLDGILFLQELSAAARTCFESQRIVYPKPKHLKRDKSSPFPSYANAVCRTRHAEKAFINSILNRYQYVDGLTDPTMVHFEDGSKISEAILSELLATSERLAHYINWKAGDVVMLDNTWILHGRRAFTGPRVIATRMANLRPKRAVWRR